MAHDYFDRLSGVAPRDRKPGDLIAPGFFDRLNRRMDAFANVTRHVDKHIAHSPLYKAGARRDLEASIFEMQARS